VRLEWGHHWRETLHCLETHVEMGGDRLTINLELLCLSVGVRLSSILFIDLHTLSN
jgi:hypothetical protein